MMMKKGKWSREEDNLIRNHIEKHGIGRSWQALSNTLGLQRCGRSCRSRWLNYLRPGLKHGNFTPTEDKIICDMYRERGSCWSVIATQLPGRTDLAIKNYWNCTLKKRFPTARTAIARRRTRSSPTASTSSVARKPVRDLQLVVYSEEGSIAGSNYTKPALTCSSTPVTAAQAFVPVAADREPIEAVPITVSTLVRTEQRLVVRSLPLTTLTPPPSVGEDQNDEMVMDIIGGPMSPRTLGSMDSELACICGLDDISGFDDINSFLSWFDSH